MKEYGKKGFEKAFMKAVPNFDETIAHFSHESRSYGSSFINIVWNGKLWHFKIYRTDYHINIWKNHFIEFFNTKEFDYNGYWRKYTSKRVAGEGLENEDVGEIYKIPLCKNLGSDFYEHSPELQEFYKTPEGEGIGKEYGFHVIPKTL